MHDAFKECPTPNVQRVQSGRGVTPVSTRFGREIMAAKLDVPTTFRTEPSGGFRRAVGQDRERDKKNHVLA